MLESTSGQEQDEAVRSQLTVLQPPEASPSAAPGGLARVWRTLRRYPIPAGALILLIVALALWILAGVDVARWALIAVILLGGIPLLWQTARQIFHGELSVDLIAILAIGGSLLLGQYLAGAIVVLMLSGGEALEAYALHRARRELAALADRAPRTARVRSGAELVTVSADSVEIGMDVVVRPGELVPVDGVVIAGTSSVSEADLTGEPLPVRKEAGALLLSGSVNLESVLDVRATRRAAESHYAQIVRLVEDAQSHKAPIHRLADRYAVFFTAISLAIAGVAWALSGDSIYALAVLVVATPCPLILATPIAIMSGIDRAAKNGIIVKSGAAIEQLGEVDVAVFDKTGTLTLGAPKLVDVSIDGADTTLDTGMIVQWAASVEQYSSHVLARAVVDEANARSLALLPVTDLLEVAGHGVSGVITLPASPDALPEEEGAVRLAIGNRTFMRSLAIPLPEWISAERDRRAADGQIASVIAVDGQAGGLLVFADVPRPELSQLVPQLKAAQVVQTVLLTGDGPHVAQQVAALAGMDRVVAQCLPEHKVAVIQELLTNGSHVLMVGDGVNDAPALALATVGVAMGAQGLTASASVADAVLLSSDILKIATAVRLGRRVMRIARQGIWIGMGLSFVAMGFAAFGFIQPAVGAVLQEGIDVLVILNALRAGRS
ncbi:MAG TPA: heavy metal translocating P-type ATPase [Ktedonobacterales bacterium]